MTLAMPEAMVENGFAKFLLPRFMLKHGVRVTPVGPGETADARLDPDGGKAAFSDASHTFGLVLVTTSPHAEKFADWLTSDVGLRTVTSFKIDGTEIYGPPKEVVEEVVETVLSGDAQSGQQTSVTACGRCHVVGDINRMAGIGSTPSFAVLRTLGDWQERFETFYVLNPHPAFTIITDVTLPFDESRPSPISPIEVTLDELENIVAYVAAMAPAELGSPIEHQ